MCDDDSTLTAKQAAEVLQVHYRLVVREAVAGRLPGRKVGRSWRFSEQALRAWLRNQDQPPTP